MTAISLPQAPQRPAQFSQHSQSSAAHLSRAATLAASVASSPARNPGSFSRQTTRAMSQLQAQYAEASAFAMQQNGPIRSSSPAHAASRPAQSIANARRRTASPIPSSSQRPSSAPGDSQGTAQVNGTPHDETSDNERHTALARRSKPPLLRSKSEHGLRHDEADTADEEHCEWGARHGFEDHYQSEDVILQLANVSGICVVSALANFVRRSATSALDPPQPSPEPPRRAPQGAGCFRIFGLMWGPREPTSVSRRPSGQVRVAN